MKNQTTPTLFTGLFLLFCFFLPAQTPNQARIFELTDSNSGTVATEIITYMNTFPYIINIPSHTALVHFLTTPFVNGNINYDPSICSPPLVRVYNTSPSSNISFRFDNKEEIAEKGLLVGALNYSSPNPVITFVPYGEEIFEGLDFPVGFIQYNIFLLGTLSSECQSNPGGQCISKMEILIVDKNIL